MSPSISKLSSILHKLVVSKNPLHKSKILFLDKAILRQYLPKNKSKNLINKTCAIFAKICFKCLKCFSLWMFYMKHFTISDKWVISVRLYRRISAIILISFKPSVCVCVCVYVHPAWRLHLSGVGSPGYRSTMLCWRRFFPLPSSFIDTSVWITKPF